MNRYFLAGVGLALECAVAAAAPAQPVIPETIYQWVQSSARMNYFFNKEEMRYGIDEAGQISTDTLLVPVIKTYDEIQIDDIRTKRRWRMEPDEMLATIKAVLGE